MIGKISKSGSFRNLIEYLNKEDAVVLGTNMYGRGNRELTAEFLTIRDLNRSIKQPVLHASLSLSPGESLTDEQLTEACETWIEKMGFDLAKNQYIIFRHKDTEHEHAHIAINRIDMLSGKVVVDSFERYKSQEIIRQLERNYRLEQVAPSWQTFKNKERNQEQNTENYFRQKLTAEIEQASIGKPTMPEFFQRLAEREIRSEVNFTRNGKPKGITYYTESGEKLAGNALGKAYSFPGLQKYLKVNYDPGRDNRQLAEIVHRQKQDFQELQQRSQESHSPLPSLEQVEEQPEVEEKSQHVWEPQYGIPAIEDLIKAIPEHSKQFKTESDLETKATYQQWAEKAIAIYKVASPRDVDQRISFLMLLQQQSPKQITQVLAHSPAVQELVKRDKTYVQSYSEFCQSQACNNETNWLVELNQYNRAVEIERQRQEQQRRIKEQQQQEQRERESNLKLLGQWEETAIHLGRSANYVKRIREITVDYKRGIPLSDKTIEAYERDFATREQQIQAQRQQRGRGLSL